MPKAAVAPEVAGEFTAEESAFFDSKGGETVARETPAVEPAKPAPEAKTVPEAPAEAEPDPGKPVPYGAFKEEREKRRGERERREKAEADFLKLQSRLDTLTEIAKSTVAPQQTEPVKATEPQIPDIATDPVGHFRAKDAIREREIQELRTWKLQQEQQGTAINNVQRIAQLAQSREAEFKKTTPDYDDASTYLRTVRDKQLTRLGYDEAARLNIIAQDAISIAATALGKNENPANWIYQMAQDAGYAPKAAKGAELAGAAAPAKPAAPNEAEKVRMAAKGQEAGSSLGQINGAANPPTTLNKLLEMDDDEFAEATKGRNWRKLVEGMSR